MKAMLIGKILRVVILLYPLEWYLILSITSPGTYTTNSLSDSFHGDWNLWLGWSLVSWVIAIPFALYRKWKTGKFCLWQWIYFLRLSILYPAMLLGMIILEAIGITTVESIWQMISGNK